jgi:hypothetical protein
VDFLTSRILTMCWLQVLRRHVSGFNSLQGAVTKEDLIFEVALPNSTVVHVFSFFIKETA